jgi:hypothetical protein
MRDRDHLFVYHVGTDSTALGKPCALCAEPFHTGDHITLAVGAARPASAVGVHTGCLPPLPLIP